MENWDQGEEKCREGLSINTDDSLRSLKLINLLKRFLGIQQKRAEAYTKLHKGFSDYMVNGADFAYQQLCAEITVVFSNCSKQILEMESLLMHPDLCRGDLAGLLKDIQEQEKQKLQFILKHKTVETFPTAGIHAASAANLLIVKDGAADCSCQPSKYPLPLAEALGMHKKGDYPAESGSCFYRVGQDKKEYGNWNHWTAQIQLLKKAGRPSERLVSHENCCFRSPTEHECVHIHQITVADGVRDAEADAEYDASLKEAIRGVQCAVTAINEHLEEVRYEIEALESEQLERLIQKSESIQIC